MSVDSGMGNRSAQDDLEAIEDDKLPGTSNVDSVFASLRKRLAQDNPTNTDENDNRTRTVDVMSEPKGQTPLDTSLSDGGPQLDTGFNTVIDSTVPTTLASKTEEEVMTFNKTAWVMENGEAKCASCEQYYIPESESHAKTAHCGFPGCADAEGKVDYTQEGMEFVPNGNADNHFTLTAGKIEEGDVVDGDVIKTGDEETKLASTEDYLVAFTKTANDSELYYRGYEDARSGKPLDEDLSELSDDYFNGYDQFKFYNKDNQTSSPQTLFDIKPNSNQLDRGVTGEEAPGYGMSTMDRTSSVVTAGGMECAQCGDAGNAAGSEACKSCKTPFNNIECSSCGDRNAAGSAACKSCKSALGTIASVIPVDVIEKFFGE